MFWLQFGSVKVFEKFIDRGLAFRTWLREQWTYLMTLCQATTAFPTGIYLFWIFNGLISNSNPYLFPVIISKRFSRRSNPEQMNLTYKHTWCVTDRGEICKYEFHEKGQRTWVNLINSISDFAAFSIASLNKNENKNQTRLEGYTLHQNERFPFYGWNSQHHQFSLLAGL